MKSDVETLAFYNKIAEQSVGQHQHAKEGHDLTEFLNLLPMNGLVLDLGCGMGQSALAMMNSGFKVKAMDASQGMVDMARAIGVDAKLASFFDLVDTQVYDGIWCNFALLHAPMIDVPRHLEAMKTALKQGGILHLSVIEGAGEIRDHLGRMYTYFDAMQLQDMLANAGLTLTHFERGQKNGMGKDSHPIMIIRAHA